jgi:predicted nucleotidyltransferase
MNLAKPHALGSNTVDWDVLRVLAGTTNPLTGREVSRIAGRSQPAVQEVLSRLALSGVVSEEPAGRAYLYLLNREHLAAPAVELLTSLRARLFDAIRDEIGRWKVKPAHASVFGSAARGDGSEASDVDVFLVRPKEIDDDDEHWADQVDQLARRIRAWSGNHAGIVQVAETELGRLNRDRPQVVADIEAEGIALYGAPPARVFKDASR